MFRGEIQLAPITLVLCLAGVARADIVRIDLSNLVNADLTTYTGGDSYPQHGGPLTVGGITFDLATIGSQHDTAVVQTSGTQDFSIPVNISGVSSVDVLVNSAFGICGTQVGAIDFVGSSQTDTYKLTEGGNLRDHFNGSFCNAAGGVAGSANFGNDRLDLNVIKLPAAFLHQTLESIDFKGFGNYPFGEPFLAAVTLVDSSDPVLGLAFDAALDPAPVPEPSNILLICAFCGAILLLKHRRGRQDG